MKKILLILLSLICIVNLNSESLLVSENWTLIAEGSTNWIIEKEDDTKSYYYSYVDAGGQAPSKSFNGVYWDSLKLESSSINSVDIYIKTLNGSGAVIAQNAPVQPRQAIPHFRNYASKDFLLAVSMGQVAGHSIVDKFGENPAIDTGTAPEDIWENGGVYIYDEPDTAPIRFVSSSSALDAGNSIIILGLDINGVEVEQEILTNGQSNVVLSTPLWRVYRMSNSGNEGTSLTGVLYCHTDPTPTSGVPIETAIRAIINNGNNQTLMAIYTVPLGKVGFLYRGELGVSRSQTSGEARTAYFSRRFGKLFTVKKRINLTNQGSSTYQDRRSFPDIIPALTDLKLTVESVSANDIGVWGAFDILLVDESLFTSEYLKAIGQVGY